jgi:hypothetical protein
VPFKGVTFDPLQLVSEWMPGGELREYVKEHRDTNLIGLVGPFLLSLTQRLTRVRCSASLKALLISTHATLFMETSKGCVQLLILAYPF